MGMSQGDTSTPVTDGMGSEIPLFVPQTGAGTVTTMRGDEMRKTRQMGRTGRNKK